MWMRYKTETQSRTIRAWTSPRSLNSLSNHSTSASSKIWTRRIAALTQGYSNLARATLRKRLKMMLRYLLFPSSCSARSSCTLCSQSLRKADCDIKAKKAGKATCWRRLMHSSMPIRVTRRKTLEKITALKELRKSKIKLLIAIYPWRHYGCQSHQLRPMAFETHLSSRMWWVASSRIEACHSTAHNRIRRTWLQSPTIATSKTIKITLTLQALACLLSSSSSYNTREPCSIRARGPEPKQGQIWLPLMNWFQLLGTTWRQPLWLAVSELSALRTAKASVRVLMTRSSLALPRSKIATSKRSEARIAQKRFKTFSTAWECSNQVSMDMIGSLIKRSIDYLQISK